MLQGLLQLGQPVHCARGSSAGLVVAGTVLEKPMLCGKISIIDVVGRNLQSGLVRQLLKDISVEDSIANKPHALTHHVGQDVLSFRADRDHIS